MGCGSRSRRHAAPRVVAFALALALTLPGEAAEPVAVEDSDTVEVVETRVRGRTRGYLEIRRFGDELFVPLDELGPLLDVHVVEEEHGARLDTPLGPARIPADGVRRIGRRTWASAAHLDRELRTSVSFDRRSWSLDLVPPWSGPRPRTPAERKVEIDAPEATISGLRMTYDHLSTGLDRRDSVAARMVGRIADGVWTVEAGQSRGAEPSLREYSWYGRRDQRHYLAGKTRVGLLASLGSFDLAGLQVGFSSRKADGVESAFGRQALFPRRGQPVTRVVGHAPPGSFVQLRIDGRPVDTVQVGYAGEYRFDAVALPTRSVAEIETLIFSPDNLQIPVEIRRERTAASEYLQGAGEVLHAGGVGLAGAFSQGLVTDASGEYGELGGYYLGRVGLNDAVTTEAIAQYDGTRAAVYAGAVFKLTDTTVASGGILHSRGRAGYRFEIERYARGFELRAASSILPEGFSGEETFRRVDHRVEVTGGFGPRLRLGLVGRELDDGTRRSTYLLPTLYWRPVADLRLDARPDLDGDYLVGAWWQIDRASRVRFYRADTSSVDWNRRFGGPWDMGWTTRFENVAPHHTLYGGMRFPEGRGTWLMRAGLVRSVGEWGYTVTASAPLLPGIQARAEYHSLPVASVANPGADRLTFHLVTDYGQSGGRFVPGDSSGFRRELGGIMGRIVAAEGGALPAEDLSGVRILVDGKGAGVTDAGGHFFLAGIEPGVYEVELSPDRLPIELTPSRSSWIVRVRSAAATRVDVPVLVRYGLAGRVIDSAGRAIPDAVVSLRDESGHVLAEETADRFGLFRFDEVPRGGYDLVVEHELGRDLRRVEVVDDYLFGQDLMLPAPVRGGERAGY